MNRLYKNKPKDPLKIKAKAVITTNMNTGEVTEQYQETYDIQKRHPQKGYKGIYMKELAQIIEVSKSAQKLFFALINYVDENNTIVGKWSSFTDMRPDTVSKAKKELDNAGFIGKIGKVWVLNPYVVLPKHDKYTSSQYNIQRIWTRYMEDANAYYPEIDQDAHDIYGVELPKS